MTLHDLRSRARTLLPAATLVAALVLAPACGGKKDAAPGEEGAAAAKKGAEPAKGGAEATPKAAAGEPGEPAKAEPAKAGDEAKPAEGPKETVEVVLWHSYRAKEREALQQVIDTYNGSQQEVRIRAQAIPYDPFVDKISITVPRGQGPDLFIFAHNMIGDWVEKKILYPLSGQVEPDLLKGFLPQSVKALVYRKNLYGLPLAFKSLVLFYNKALLPEVPATMEELITKLKALQTKDVRGLLYEAGGLYYHAMWIHAFGGAIFDAEHKPAFATPEQKAALEFARSLHFEHKLLPKGISGFALADLWNRGKAAVVFNGPWFRAEIDPKLDYGVATIPTVQGKTPKPLMGIESVFISSASTKKEAALKAAKYLAGAESAAVRMRVGKQPVCHAATLAAVAAEDASMKVFQEQGKSAVLMDASPEMQLVWSTADMAVANGVFVDDSDIPAALQKAQDKIVADMGRRGE